MGGRRPIPLRSKLSQVAKRESSVAVIQKIVDGPENMLDRPVTIYLTFNEVDSLIAALQKVKSGEIIREIFGE